MGEPELEHQFYFLYIYLFGGVCVCIKSYTYHTEHVTVRDTFLEPILFFHHVGLRDGSQVFRLGSGSPPLLKPSLCIQAFLFL